MVLKKLYQKLMSVRNNEGDNISQYFSKVVDSIKSIGDPANAKGINLSIIGNKPLGLFLIFTLTIMLSLSFVSAFNFDNAGSYDEINKEITIKNAFGLGDEIARIKLISSLEEYVPRGFNRKVAELEFYNFDRNYGKALNDMDFYDVNNGDKKIDRQFRYAYKKITGTEQVLKQTDYICDGDLDGNNTRSCRNVKTYEVKDVVEWIEFRSIFELPSGKVTVGIFTDVLAGDRVEWIPTFFGVRITEWAVWTDSLAVDLTRYYFMNDSSEKDSIFNFTASEGTAIFNDVDALIGLNFNSTTDNNLNLSSHDDINFTNGTGTLNLWVWSYNTNPNQVFLETNITGSLLLEFSGSTMGINGFSTPLIVSLVGNSTWSMLTLVSNGSGVDIYFNGSLEGSREIVNAERTAVPYFFGGRPSGANDFDGKIDEVAFWDRNLSSVEINDLYNNGSAITFRDAGVFLLTPTDNTQTSNTTINFTANIEPLVNGESLVNATLNVWFRNGTLFNETTNAESGTVQKLTSFNVTGFDPNTYDWNVYVCSSDVATTCSFASSNFSLTVGIDEVALGFLDAVVYETQTKLYNATFNVSAGTPTGSLWWNGTQYTATATNLGGNSWELSRVLEIPLGSGNKSIFFDIFLGNININTTISSQIENLTVLGLCNSTLDTPYINFTYQNETTANEDVNAFVSSSEWTYWLGDGSVNKTLSFSNANEFNNHSFCFEPEFSTVNTELSYSYDNAESQQRTYAPSTLELTNSTTEQILFLLPTNDGIFVTFQVINTAQQPISDAEVTLSRAGFGTIATETTGASGTVNIFLNPSFAYTLTVTATGFDTFTATQTFPTTEFTVNLGSVAITSNDFTKGITTVVRPRDRVLANDTDFVFNFTLGSSFWNLDSYGFVLTNRSGAVLGIVSDTKATGGIVSFNHNTGNRTSGNGSVIVMEYFWEINDSFSNGTIIWSVMEGAEGSIVGFFDRLDLYLDNGGVFGLTKFGLMIILFLIIFITVGILALNFGLNNPIPLAIGVFGFVLVFDYTGIMPEILGKQFVVTTIVGLIALAIVLQEVRR